jgi:hypothetical protein
MVKQSLVPHAVDIDRLFAVTQGHSSGGPIFSHLQYSRLGGIYLKLAYVECADSLATG